MMFESILWWPFALAIMGIMFLIGIASFVFWIWMIVDCAQRKFKNDAEKIIWIIVIVLGSLIGSITYFIVIKLYNQKGLMRKN